jgi:hypothetical protein
MPLELGRLITFVAGYFGLEEAVVVCWPMPEPLLPKALEDVFVVELEGTGILAP